MKSSLKQQLCFLMCLILLLTIVPFEMIKAESARVSERDLTSIPINQQDFVSFVLNNPEKYLMYSNVVDSYNISIYEYDQNTKVTVTNGKVEIIKQLSETLFEVNGEPVEFKITTEDDYLINLQQSDFGTLGWSNGSVPVSDWIYSTQYTRNIEATKTFISFTVGTLAAFIQTFFPVYGFAAASAATIIRFGMASSNVARIVVNVYESRSAPRLYRRLFVRNYVRGYDGIFASAGNNEITQSWVPGGP